MVRQGDQIELVAMGDDPHPLRSGDRGTVVSVSRHGCGRGAWHQIDVLWDSGRSLMLVSPPDQFRVVAAAKAEEAQP